MVDTAVLRFLKALGQDADLLAKHAQLSKQQVLRLAAQQGYSFSEGEFDATLWETEAALAARIGEAFNFSCSMWETMWGKTYLEYLTLIVAPVALETVHNDAA
jgi:hypothetical protein